MANPESSSGIRVLIVDDEAPARRRILHLLKNDLRFYCIGEADNGADAVSAILDLKPDLVFLDIQIPEMDGFEVIRTIRPVRMPTVIFVTAFNRYAVRAFEVHALDYLLKPFVVDRFRSALGRAADRIRAARTGGGIRPKHRNAAPRFREDGCLSRTTPGQIRRKARPR
jgi:two-component system LytT family response regulator